MRDSAGMIVFRELLQREFGGKGAVVLSMIIICNGKYLVHLFILP